MLRRDLLNLLNITGMSGLYHFLELLLGQEGLLDFVHSRFQFLHLLLFHYLLNLLVDRYNSVLRLGVNYSADAFLFGGIWRDVLLVVVASGEYLSLPRFLVCCLGIIQTRCRVVLLAFEQRRESVKLPGNTGLHGRKALLRHALLLASLLFHFLLKLLVQVLVENVVLARLDLLLDLLYFSHRQAGAVWLIFAFKELH